MRRTNLLARTIAAAGLSSLVVVTVACSSSGSSTNADGLSCRTSQIAQAVIDYADGTRAGGMVTPDGAVTAYLSGPGKGLPTGGYSESASQPSQAHGAAPSSVTEPGQASPVSFPTKYFVHRSGDRVDVTLTLESRGGGSWLVSNAGYCPDARN
jgi:hypothetical protein